MVSGTAGSTDQLAKWNADGDLVAAADAMALITKGDGWAAEVTLASAATCDILGAASNRVVITGTTAITSLGTGTNKLRFVRFSGALTLTHNATSLILPSAKNITSKAGDTCVVISDGSSNARVFAYQRGDQIGQQTISIPAGAMEPRVTTAPAISNAVEITTSFIAARTMDFATGADDFCTFGPIKMPKG